MVQEQDEKGAEKFVFFLCEPVRFTCFVSLFAGCVFRRKKSALVLWFITSSCPLFFDGSRSSGTELDERGDLSWEEAKSLRSLATWRLGPGLCLRPKGGRSVFLSSLR